METNNRTQPLTADEARETASGIDRFMALVDRVIDPIADVFVDRLHLPTSFNVPLRLAICAIGGLAIGQGVAVIRHLLERGL